MRKTLALAAAALLGAGPAAAAPLKVLSFGGQIDLQATSGRNLSDFATRRGLVPNNDRIGDAQTRLLLTVNGDLLDDVHAVVTFRKNDRTYGTAGGNPQPSFTSKSQSLTGAGASDVAGNVFLDQAYFKIDKLGGQVDATFGRQFFGEPGDLVIYFGPSDKALYGLAVQAIDAARGDWANESVGVTALVGKVTGHPVGAAPLFPIDVDVRGITAHSKGLEGLEVGAYLWNQLTHGTAALGQSPGVLVFSGKNDNLYVLGAKVKATLGPALLKAELAKNFGEFRQVQGFTFDSSARNYVGWAAKLDAELKTEFGGVGTITDWLQFGFGTGRRDRKGNKDQDFRAISGDYRPGAIYGRFAPPSPLVLGGAPLFGYASSNSLTNRVILGAGAKLVPAAESRLTVGASLYHYNTQAGFFPTVEGSPAVFDGNRQLGWEADLEASWRHSENVSLSGGVGSFQPGGVIKAANRALGQPTNPATLAFFDARVKFGR